jgi:HSP20 family protein
MLTLWNGFDRAFDREAASLDKLFDQMTPSSGLARRMMWANHPAERVLPAVDLVETEDGYELSADVPGFTPDMLDITLEDGVLTIKGDTGTVETKAEGEAESAKVETSGRVLRRERKRVSFERSFRFETALDGDAIAADMEHGVLTLRLPKAAAAKAKSIPVVAK